MRNPLSRSQFQLVNSLAANIGFNAMEWVVFPSGLSSSADDSSRYWFQRSVLHHVRILPCADEYSSLFNALLYAVTPAAFPAPIRGSASGMLSTLGRISGIVGLDLLSYKRPKADEHRSSRQSLLDKSVPTKH